MTDVVCTTFKELKNQFPNNTPLADLIDEDLCDRAARRLQRCIDNPSLDMCEGLPKLALEEACESLPNNPFCEALLPDTPGGGGGPNVPDPDNPLPSVPGVPRIGYGPTENWSARGPTMGDLMKVYDPDLVALLIPGMVTR